MAFELTEELKQKFDSLLSRYPETNAALLPVLDLAQRANGYLSVEVMDSVADHLKLPATKVYEVATFYTMLHKKPVGQYHIQVCTNIACSLMGAETIYEYLKKRLAIDKGEVTKDGRFSLEEVECLASCGTAPMMQINDDYFEELTPEKIDRILDDLN